MTATCDPDSETWMLSIEDLTNVFKASNCAEVNCFDPSNKNARSITVSDTRKMGTNYHLAITIALMIPLVEMVMLRYNW